MTFCHLHLFFRRGEKILVCDTAKKIVERMIFSSENLIPGVQPIACSDSGEVVSFTTSKRPFLDGGESLATSDCLFPIELYSDYVPNVDRLTIFLPGNPGAGKSYYASQLIQRLPLNTQILLFTSLDEFDSNFEPFRSRINKVRMHPDVLKKINVRSIRERIPRDSDVVAVFDDIDKISDKKQSKLVFSILEDLLANGRIHDKRKGVRGNIHVIATTHSLNDWLKTKYLTENCNYVGLFPQSTTHIQLERLLSKLGLGKDMCKIIKDTGERVVVIHKTAPMFIMAGSSICLIT